MLTNDPHKSTVVLKITGPVERFANIKPSHIQLRGEPGVEISAISTIEPTEAYPFKILKTTTSPNIKFEYSLDERTGEGEKGWVLRVWDPNPQGRYSGTIFLHTDNQIKHKLEVRVHGNFVGKRSTTIKPALVPKKNNTPAPKENK